MVLVYGGSVTALTTVLVYSLIPEFELPDTFPPIWWLWTRIGS